MPIMSLIQDLKLSTLENKWTTGEAVVEELAGKIFTNLPETDPACVVVSGFPRKCCVGR